MWHQTPTALISTHKPYSNLIDSVFCDYSVLCVPLVCLSLTHGSLIHRSLTQLLYHMEYVKEYINKNIQSYVSLAKFVGTLKVEQWITIVCGSFLFGIVVANGQHSTTNILVYGKNSQAPKKTTGPPSSDLFNRGLALALKYSVPKKYFLHFYIFFFGLTIANQLIYFNFQTSTYPGINRFFTQLYSNCCVEYEVSATNYKNLMVISNLLLIQACRRLYEDLFVTKFSTNTMNVLHYIFGLGFYLMLATVNLVGLLPYYINLDKVAYGMNLEMADWAFVFAFLFYLIDQYQNHVHLASLVKYTIPSFRFFEYCSSPHYLDEIIMYSILLRFYLACESIGWVKADFCMIWMLVVANLSVSANYSYEFYKNKFKEGFKTPYKLVPFVW